jgi:putative ABC transport system permease protein
MGWFRRLWHKSVVDKQLDSELNFHLEQQIAVFISSGFSPVEARRRANLEFGGIERFKEECRDVHAGTRAHQFLYDLRYAWRSLRKDFRFSLLAVFALAIGIGCSTVIFSIVYNGVLHPFPYQGGERLVALAVWDLAKPAESKEGKRALFTLSEIRAFRERNHTLEDVVGWGNWDLLYKTRQGTEYLHGCRVTANAFEFFGVTPLLGRILTPQDAQPGATPVAAIDYKLWQRLFHSDRSVIGTQMILDDTPVTIVAVMPQRFTPDGADLWAPVPPGLERADPKKIRDDNEPTYFFATGRLKRGATPAAAGADLDVIARQIANNSPDDYPQKFATVARSLSDAVVADFKAILDFLIAAVGMLLLISCGNVATLLLVRATAREREIALRAAIGASHGRLVRLLLTEAFLLVGLGCFSGCMLAFVGVKLMLAHLPPRIPGEADISLNWPVLGFAVLASLVIVFLCGLSPALHAAGGSFRNKLTSAGAVATSSRQGKLRSGLIVGEVALSMALLVFAGLMLRSFHALTHVPFGFDPSRVLSANLRFPKGRYTTASQKKRYFDRVLPKVAELPGVTAVATSIIIPLKHSAGSVLVIQDKASPDPHSERSVTMLDLCSEGIFRIFDIDLVKGRVLTAEDVAAARRVAVVNQTFVREFFANADPVGQRFKLMAFDELPESPYNAYFEIVGVVSDVRNRGLEGPPFQQVYVPFSVSGFAHRDLMVRTSVDPLVLLNSVRQQVWAVDRDVALADPEGLNNILSRVYFAAPQFGVFAITAFAAVGLLLVVIGVFGVMAYSVSLQRHEIGLRVALGAQPGAIVRMVLSKGLRLISAGVVIGLFVALAAAHGLRHQFWQFSPADPLTYSVVSLLLISVGLLACWIPARHATSVTPMNALRYD